MKNVALILSALSSGLSATVAVLVASPGVGFPPEAIVGLTALAAGLAAVVAILAREPTA